MGKFSIEDKMRIQILCEQGLGYKRIVAAYPHKKWKLDTAKAICKRYHKTGSAINMKNGNGRPKSARCNENIETVSELLCSQESQPSTNKSTREIARHIGIGQTSVMRIAKQDLRLSCFNAKRFKFLQPPLSRRDLIERKH